MKTMLSFALSIFLLIACTPEPSLPGIPATEISTRGFSEDESPITAEVIRVDSRSGTFRFTNETDEDFYYGTEYRLEQLVDGQWLWINTEMDFIDPAFPLPAHRFTDMNLTWDWLFEQGLPAGTFRIRSNFLPEDARFIGTGFDRQYEAVIEFRLNAQ